MSAATVADLVDLLRQSRLLDAARLEKVSKAQDRFPDALTLAKELVRRGWLTREQARALLQGQPVAPAAAAVPVAEPVVAAPPPAPRRRRGAWLLALLALLLLAGGGGVAVWWSQRGTGTPTNPGTRNNSTGGSLLASPVKGCSDTSDLKVLDDLEFGDSVRAAFDPKFLDALKDKEIPKVEVYPWQPPGLVAVLGEHRMRGTVIAANPDGTLLAVAGQDDFIRIGPIDTLHEKAVLDSPAKAHALAWSKGDVLAAAHGDDVVRLWDVRNLDKVPEPVVLKKGAKVTSLAFSHDGKYLIGGGRVGDDRGALWLWNVETKEEVYSKPQSAPVQCVAFSPAPDDYRVLWGGGRGDGQLYLWDGVKGTELAHIDFKYAGKKEDERSYLTRVAFAPDGKRAVSGHYEWNLDLGKGDWLVRVWDLERFALGKEKHIVKGFADAGPLVAFGPDNKTVALARMADNSVSLLDVDGVARPRPVARSNGVYSLMFLPRGGLKEDRLAFAGSNLADYNVHVHEAATGQELRPPVGHLNAVLAVAGSPDGANLVSGGSEGQTWLWDLDKVAPRHRAPSVGPVWNVGFHPDGRQAFYCGNATVTVPFIDVATGKAAGPANYDERHNGAITNAVVTEDGHYVLTGGANDGTVRLWDLRPGPRRGKQVRIFPAGPGIATVALSPNGKRALRSADRSLKLLHLRCQEVRREWVGGSWNTFLPDGRVAILGGPTGKLWDVGEDEPKEAGTLRASLAGVSSGDVSRDGRRLAGVGGGRIAVWDREVEKPLWEWTPPLHFGGVRAVALSSDGRYLFTANGDGTVYVIQLPPVNEIRNPNLEIRKKSE